MYYFSVRRQMSVGEKEIEFETKESEKAENIFGEILDTFPNLKNYGKSLLFSVNQEYSDGAKPSKTATNSQFLRQFQEAENRQKPARQQGCDNYL